MDNREAVNWLINISADIGKVEHSGLWHYERALTEIKDMLESAQLSHEGATSDLISRQAAIDALKMDISIIPFAKAREYVREAIETIYNRLEELPPAQPEPKEGYWIEGGIYRDVIECHCSECGQIMTTAASVRMNYCPHCGKKMLKGKQ